MHRPAYVMFAVAAFAAIAAAFQQAPSAIAGTPVSRCMNTQQATAQIRVLASASPAPEACLTQLLREGSSKLRFYAHHRWTLSPRYDKWWQIPSLKRRNIARKARAEVRYYSQVVLRAKAKLQKLQTLRWLSSSFDCIHGHEGAWNADTGNQYYGGLQMDIGFQTTYGSEFLRRWGTANNWPVWAQKLAAIRAYLSGRGFGPWPYTAAACGYSVSKITPMSLSV